MNSVNFINCKDCRSPPEESYMVVSQYHICVDGKVRTIVPGNYKVFTIIPFHIPINEKVRKLIALVSIRDLRMNGRIGCPIGRISLLLSISHPTSLSFETRALVEDISMEGSSNLSIRSVTEHGHSPDAACTITLGLGM